MATSIGEKEANVRENRMMSSLRSVLKMHIRTIGASMEVLVSMQNSKNKGCIVGENVLSG